MKSRLLKLFFILCISFIVIGNSNPTFAQSEKISITVTSADIETMDVSNEEIHSENTITIPETRFYDYEITFLYKKSSNITTVPPSEPIDGTTNNIDKVTKKPEPPILNQPRGAVNTGDNSRILQYAFGLFLSSLILFCLIKYKKFRNVTLMLVLGIILSYETFISYGNGHEFGEILNFEKEKSETFSISAWDVEGYEYVGYIIKYKEPVDVNTTPELGKLTVLHLDFETGIEVAPKLVTFDNLGKPFTISAVNIPGYILVESPDSEEGVYEKNDIVKIYKYKGVKGTVIVKYVDDNTGKEIKDSLVLKDNVFINEAYSSNRESTIEFENEIYHLLLDKLPDNETGIVKEGYTEVVYRYDREDWDWD